MYVHDGAHFIRTNQLGAAFYFRLGSDGALYKVKILLKNEIAYWMWKKKLLKHANKKNLKISIVHSVLACTYLP